MQRVPETVTISELKRGQATVLEKIETNPLLLLQLGKPAAVMIAPTQWNQLADELFRLRLHELSRKIEARNDANNSWVSHEELMTSLEEKHGPELIAAINERLTDDVAT